MLTTALLGTGHHTHTAPADTCAQLPLIKTSVSISSSLLKSNLAMFSQAQLSPNVLRKVNQAVTAVLGHKEESTLVEKAKVHNIFHT